MIKTKRKLKLTPWYSGCTPLKSRPGLYECQCCHKLFKWTGHEWRYLERGWSGVVAEVEKWRGIAR